MRRSAWLRVVCVLGAALGLPLAATAGCSAEDEVEPAKGLMLAIRTDMSIPEDVSSMRIEVLTNGVPKLLNEYDLGPAPDKTTLPGTLALLPPSDPKLPVKVRIIARTKSGAATILREVTTTVPNDRLVMLPIGIQWLCWDSVTEDKSDPTKPTFANKTCGDKETCIAGACASQIVDSTKLAPYDPTQIFGGAKAAGAKGQCFDTLSCFDQAAAETPDSACTLAAPAAGQEDKYNVALVLPQNGGSGICGDSACLVPLERDDSEGWRIEGNRVKLPPAICQKLGSSIVAVATATACTTKTSAIPTCGPWSSVTSSSGTFDGGPELDASIGSDVSTDGAPDAADGGGDASLDTASDVPDVFVEPPPADPNLGKACKTKTDCGQLDCIDVGSTALGGEGPAGGLCTLPCAGLPAGWCGAIETGAICHPFGPGAEYCLEGCAQGPAKTDAGLDPNKCQGRADMACAFLMSGGKPAYACLPTCTTPACETSANPQCNLQSGLCTKVAPQGAPYGASCSVGPPPDGGDGGPLPCAGICSPVPNPMTPGLPGTFVCSGGCVVNPDASCGWVGSGPAAAACMKSFVPSATDVGDLGTCVQLCDCQNFCSDPNMVCTPNPDFALKQKWGMDGYCTFMFTADGGSPPGLGC